MKHTLLGLSSTIWAKTRFLVNFHDVCSFYRCLRNRHHFQERFKPIAQQLRSSEAKILGRSAKICVFLFKLFASKKYRKTDGRSVIERQCKWWSMMFWNDTMNKVRHMISHSWNKSYHKGWHRFKSINVGWWRQTYKYFQDGMVVPRWLVSCGAASWKMNSWRQFTVDCRKRGLLLYIFFRNPKSPRLCYLTNCNQTQSVNGDKNLYTILYLHQGSNEPTERLCYANIQA